MIKLLDTHQHLLYRKELDYAWSNSLPALAGKDFTIADYMSQTIGKEIAGTIFMEVDADDYRKETRFIAKLAADKKNKIFGLISSCRPETDDGFDEWLEECSHFPVVGFRRILHEVPDEISMSETFRKNVKKIGKKGRVFDMVFRADQLAIAKSFAESCDEMALVLDHCGVPDIAGGQLAGWQKGISDIAKLPNVFCKISGVLAYCAPGSSNKESIEPYFDHVLECFGAERLVWGSDWPVVNLKSDLPSWIDIFLELIAELSSDEAATVCSENATRIYKL